MVNVLEKALRVLQFVWLLPATILVWLFYIFPLLIGKEIKYKGMGEFLVFEFENVIDPLSWYDNRWEKWQGWSGPCVIIYKTRVGPGGHVMDYITLTHEGRHCLDQFWFGIFFYPAYFLDSLWIYISNFWRDEKRHPYHDNWFEKRARKAAGQRIDIPREEWMDGPNDYNPWW